jgi:hypothetical protein
MIETLAVSPANWRISGHSQRCLCSIAEVIQIIVEVTAAVAVVGTAAVAVADTMAVAVAVMVAVVVVRATTIVRGGAMTTEVVTMTTGEEADTVTIAETIGTAITTATIEETAEIAYITSESVRILAKDRRSIGIRTIITDRGKLNADGSCHNLSITSDGMTNSFYAFSECVSHSFAQSGETAVFQ